MFGIPVILAAITSLSGLRAAVDEPYREDIPFEVEGLVISANTNVARTLAYWLDDSHNRVSVVCTNRQIATEGSFVLASGHVGRERNGWTRAYVNAFRTIGRKPLPTPDEIGSDALSNPAFHGRRVCLTARVIDLVKDEIDPRYENLILRDAHGTFSVGLFRQARPTDIVGALVRVVGISVHTGGKRKFFTPRISISRRENLTILEPAPEDPFDVPTVDDLGYTSAKTVTEMGCRKAEGRVLAVWGHEHILLRTDAGHIVRADLSRATTDRPACGTRVVAVGFPTTDLFNVNLTRAMMRPCPGASAPPDTPRRVSAAELLAGEYGAHQLQPQFHGQLVTLRGRLTDIPSVHGDTVAFELHEGPYKIDVNGEACPDAVRALKPGSVLDVTGVCVLNTLNWQSGNISPRIDGMTIVLRETDDLRIVAHPPWWTVGKLACVVATLLAVIVFIFVWNRILQRLIRRRGKELARMELAKAVADLRISERTRLAVDIHDSLSQTLTGVSFQIDAAAQTVGADDAAARGFLTIAKRTLTSCREELRRCLWDLRNNAIGEPDLSTAIRHVLEPHAGSVATDVAVDIARASLTDSTAHDLLCIVRELTVNAIRHGHATHIRISGEKRGARIRLSVADNGAGFDPAHRPGAAEGHFGLQGIRERLNRLGGSLTLQTSPGNGCTAYIEIGK